VGDRTRKSRIEIAVWEGRREIKSTDIGAKNRHINRVCRDGKCAGTNKL